MRPEADIHEEFGVDRGRVVGADGPAGPRRGVGSPVDPPSLPRHRPTVHALPDGFGTVDGGHAAGGGGAAAGLPLVGAPGRGVSVPTGTLVVVNLVGGLDGLSVVVPHADPAYRARRPTIAVAAPGERHGALDLGRGIGLHPALAPLHDSLGRAERLALICGVGVPPGEVGGPGHLRARDFVHRGGRDQPEGWVARLLAFEGLGAEAVWSFGAGVHPMYHGLDMPASSHWAGIERTSESRRRELGYPQGRLGQALAETADMIRAERGLRLAAIDHDGYDTHVDQGDGRAGVLAHRLDRLARALAAFWADVGAHRPVGVGPVTVVVVSEFGRTLDENGSGGTEHGRGGVALAIGDEVVGGVHGDMVWPSDHEMWAVSIDVRRVLADAVAGHGFRPWRSGTFPGLALPNRSLGLLLSP